MTTAVAPSLGWATVPTEDGPFTAIFDDDHTVYASGWTHSLEYLESLIHPELRTTDLFEKPGGPVTEAVLQYYDGHTTAPSHIQVRQQAGPFITDAWVALRKVRAGTPVTYRQLAELAGRPTAVRGAAQCCVRNAAALFVPCHRVMRTDGSLGGYRYGLELKEDLLRREAESLAAARDEHGF
ncbi:methylated-DNA--[protein]-cysteine S-methyltransferase [Gordonia sp. (in: high G+C Gram-positive bacteria)]|uniref:methylated-DNA--[protein]-cysteine S-methyltransferase n=1 Tax=Gordonia sp. (in: high G+C Gram-positive bacteria) TaxID=84139 RepID=UPI003C77B6B0